MSAQRQVDQDGRAEVVPGGDPGELRTVPATDGVGLACRYFPPVGNARARILYLHGVQSHGGWYTETAAELAGLGYAVTLLDRRGSGLSGGVRGDFAGPDQLVGDVACVLAETTTWDAGLGTVVVGGCWGARPALEYALRHPGELAALVLVCPALAARVDLSPRNKARVFAGRLLRPQTRVPIPLRPELFTENPPFLDFIRNDPLSLRDVSARFFFEQFFWDRRLRQLETLAVPLLVLQSGRDDIVDVDVVRAWFDRLVAPRKDYRLYDDFGHILDFEDDRGRYWADLGTWLEETI